MAATQNMCQSTVIYEEAKDESGFHTIHANCHDHQVAYAGLMGNIKHVVFANEENLIHYLILTQPTGILKINFFSRNASIY